MLFFLLACNWDQGDDSKNPTTDDSGTPHETGDTGLPHETGDSGTDDSGTDDSGTDDSGTPIDGPKLTLDLDSDVVTMVRATWTDAKDDATLEYRFEGKDWLPAPAVEPGNGVILGIPSETPVDVRVVESVDGLPVYSAVESITTGTLPPAMILPDVMVYDETIAYDADYAMISFAGGSNGYSPPWWVQIIDRQGRVVWYKKVPDDLMTFYATVARDGTHIWFDADNIFGFGSGHPFVQRQTLDGRWVVNLEVDAMGEAIAEGPDYSWFYEYRTGWGAGDTVALAQLLPDGTRELIWNCSDIHESYECLMNTCNWSEEHGTVLASMFESNTVFEIDVATGEAIKQMGQMTSGDPYSFDPPESMFAYQHDPYWLESGNLLVSTHQVGVSGKQIAAEYSVDEKTKTLTRVWSYVSTDIWAEQVGEAIRLPNGNTLQGYGQNGGAREVTTDGDIAWQVMWISPPAQRTVGHMSLIPDLYALNVGGTEK
jgi:hypothetical protein